jgi:hypothetical protein
METESKALTKIEWKQKSNIKVIIFYYYHVLNVLSVLADFHLLQMVYTAFYEILGLQEFYAR